MDPDLKSAYARMSEQEKRKEDALAWAENTLMDYVCESGSGCASHQHDGSSLS
jgi:hypothetical protein